MQRIGLIIVSAVGLSTSSCSKRTDFTLSSNDGSFVLHGVEKKREIKTGKYGGWIFSDSEPNSEALSIYFVAGTERFDLPARVVRRIANPRELSFSVTRPTSSSVTISMHGGEGAGPMILNLFYTDGILRRAEHDSVASEHWNIIYP